MEAASTSDPYTGGRCSESCTLIYGKAGAPECATSLEGAARAITGLGILAAWAPRQIHRPRPRRAPADAASQEEVERPRPRPADPTGAEHRPVPARRHAAVRRSGPLAARHRGVDGRRADAGGARPA